MAENLCSLCDILFSSAQPSFHEWDRFDTPDQKPPPAAYCPKGKGIRVIQQYVSSIQEDHRRRNFSAREGNIWDYDLIGAVGLQRCKSGKVAVVYHVKWKGFPIRNMTWEPENHLFEGDLELLWLEHGRVNTTGTISWVSGHNNLLHRHCSEDVAIFEAEAKRTSRRELSDQDPESAQDYTKDDRHQLDLSVHNQTAMESLATKAIRPHSEEPDGNSQKNNQRNDSNWQETNAACPWSLIVQLRSVIGRCERGLGQTERKDDATLEA